MMVRWHPATGDYAIVAAGAGLKDLIRETLGRRHRPLDRHRGCGAATGSGGRYAIRCARCPVPTIGGRKSWALGLPR